MLMSMRLNMLFHLAVWICCNFMFIVGMPMGAAAQASALPHPTLVGAELIRGQCIRLHDGDSFQFLSSDKKRQERIRIYGIDAPEKGMPYATKAREFLAALLKGKQLQLRVQGYDKYGRILATVYVEGKDVALAMINAGYAWHYKQYSNDKTYAAAERRARQRKRGLWQEAQPLAPWQVRAYRRAGYSDEVFRTLMRKGDPRVQRFLK